MTSVELEQHISDLGRLIEKAYAEGDRASAVAWAAARVEAIKARSPEQVQAMETRLGLAPCQFVAQGDADRVAMGVADA